MAMDSCHNPCFERNQSPHIWKPTAHSAIAMACKFAKMPNELTCDGSACAKESRIFLSDFLGIPVATKVDHPWPSHGSVLQKPQASQPGTSLIHFAQCPSTSMYRFFVVQKILGVQSVNLSINQFVKAGSSTPSQLMVSTTWCPTLMFKPVYQPH